MFKVFFYAFFFAFSVGLSTLSAQPGRLDSTFADEGKLVTSLTGFGGHGTCVTLQPDGKILFGGPVWGVDSDNDFGIGRLLPNGAFDPSFSINGKLRFNVGSSLDWLNSIGVLPNGKIIAFGRTAGSIGFLSFFLACFNSDGSLDTSFGVNGRVETSITGADSPVVMRLQPDGKILTAGYGQLGNKNVLLLARYLPTGQLDLTFHSTGKFYDELDLPSRIHDIAIQADGKIVVTGYSQQLPLSASIYNYIIRRYDPNGAVDVTFGNHGLVRGEFQPGISCRASAIALQPDHKIVIAGNDDTAIVARFNEDGSVDTGFGANGVVKIETPGFYNNCYAVAIQQDDKILVAGVIQDDGYIDKDFMLARINANGSLDPDFGIDGIQSASLTTFNAMDGGDAAVAMTIQPDGNIVLVGTAHYNMAVTRHLADLNLGVIDFKSAIQATTIYPCPLKSSATLEYTLENEEDIEITLMGLDGSLLTTILSRTRQQAGEYKVPVDIPTTIPSGAYFLNISNGRRQVQVKVLKQ